MESNHIEHMFKNFECLDISAILRFKLVQRGLMYLNYTELVHKRHSNLALIKDLIREDSVKLNQFELMTNTYTLLATLKKSLYFRVVQVHRTSHNLVRERFITFNALELPQTNMLHTVLPLQRCM